ncbi:MAG: hypothetical protein WD004_00395 [Actinomycetota bacterium]
MTSPKKLPRTTLAIATGLLALFATFAVPAQAEEAGETVSAGVDFGDRSQNTSEGPGGLSRDDYGAGDPVVPVYAPPGDGGASVSSPSEGGVIQPHVVRNGIKYGPEARKTGIHCFGRLVSIVGTPHKDRIFGTNGQDVIWAGGGNDIVSSGDENDFVCGANGWDQIYTLAGNDKATGMKGRDDIFGGAGSDTLFAGLHDDTVTGEAGQDFIWGDGGDDTLYGGFTVDSGDGEGAGGLGQDSNDNIVGGPGNDVLIGGDLHDTLQGQSGNDTLDGDTSVSTDSPTIEGNDDMTGGPGRDRFNAGPGNDTAMGGTGDDIFDGGLDHDTLYGDGGLDWINGDEGLDTLDGGDQWDTLNGGTEGDTLKGGRDSDTLCGGADVDTLRGDGDNDFLSGSASDCTFSLVSLLNNFSVDQDVPNLLDGGSGGADLCVSPSTLLSPQTINCEFTGFIRLDIEIEGNGNVASGGAVGSLNEFGIDCTSPAPGSGNICSMFFLPSEVPISITLTATPANGWAFDGWSGTPPGTCPGVTNPCTFMLDQSRTVTATFVEQDTLTVTVSGPGTITSSPPGGLGSCTAGSSPCTATYNTGTSVTLSSTVALTTWTGSPAPGCAVGPTCAFTMSGTRSITAAT